MGDVRFVLDTDAVVAAMRSPTGASAAIIRAVRQKRATLLLSVPLALEYEAVCRRSDHRVEAGLSSEQVEIFLDAVIGMGEPVATHFLWRPQLRDPNDEMVLEAAVNGRADALVTFNSRDYGTAPARFGVDILLPREAIARIKQ
jgi:putative PIN family toxin of toxin-antitoxin system